MLKEEEKNSGPLKERNEEKTDDADSAERSWLANAALFFLELVKIAVLAGITIGVVRYFIFKPFKSFNQWHFYFII